MTRRHSSNLSAISVVQIIFIVGLSAGQRENEKPEALKGFSDRVKGYIDLQKKAESGLPSFKETDQPAKIDAHKAALAPPSGRPEPTPGLTTSSRVHRNNSEPSSTKTPGSGPHAMPSLRYGRFPN